MRLTNQPSTAAVGGRSSTTDHCCSNTIIYYVQSYRRFSSQKTYYTNVYDVPYYTNVYDVPRSLQSWVLTIQTVVLTADVFQLFIKKCMLCSSVQCIRVAGVRMLCLSQLDFCSLVTCDHRWERHHQYHGMALHRLLPPLLHHGVVSLCHSFVTAELVSL